MAEYRWNVSEYAAGYDAAAEHIHPHYVELQDRVLSLLPCKADDEFLLIDAGGGSGKLVERFMRRFGRARAIIVDQSEAFLALAQRRLEGFGNRTECRLARLQDEWMERLPEAPTAIASMSAIHHLDPGEKRLLYQRCHEVLRPGGIFINADEVRPADDARYLAECRTWVGHMKRVMEAGLVAGPMGEALSKWEERNVNQFGRPRISGDDCHETIEVQLEYLRACGFDRVDSPWQKEMWAIMRGVK